MLINEPHGAEQLGANAFTRASGPVADLVAKHAPRVIELAHQATALKKAAEKIQPSGDDGVGEVLAALETGTVDKLDIVKAVGPGVHRDAEFMHTHNVLSDVLHRLRTEQHQLVMRAATDMFDALDDQVQTAVAALRKTAIARAGVSTLEAAADAKLVDKWTEYAELRAQHAQAYTIAQGLVRVVDSFAIGEYVNEHFAISRLANGEDVWPGLIPVLAELSNANEPWRPGREDSARDPELFLSWLIATPDAKPALFSLDEQRARRDELRPAIVTARAEAAHEAGIKQPNPFQQQGRVRSS